MTGEEGRGAVGGAGVCSVARCHCSPKGSCQPTEDRRAGGLWDLSNQQLFTFPRGEFGWDARKAGPSGRKCYQRGSDELLGCVASCWAVWPAAGSDARGLS